MKATEQYFPVVLFIMLYKVVPSFEVKEILKFDHSNESYSSLPFVVLFVLFLFIILNTIPFLDSPSLFFWPLLSFPLVSSSFCSAQGSCGEAAALSRAEAERFCLQSG